MITKPIRPDNFEDLPTLEKMAIEIEEFQKEFQKRKEEIKKQKEEFQKRKEEFQKRKEEFKKEISLKDERIRELENELKKYV